MSFFWEVVNFHFVWESVIGCCEHSFLFFLKMFHWTVVLNEVRVPFISVHGNLVRGN